MSSPICSNMSNMLGKIPAAVSVGTEDGVLLQSSLFDVEIQGQKEVPNVFEAFALFERVYLSFGFQLVG